MNSRGSRSVARRVVACIVGAALFARCSPPPNSPLPSATASPPATTPVVTSSPSAYAIAPPGEVQDWLAANLRLTFRPLTSSELATVRLTTGDAERLALADPGPGYGPDGARFTWEKIGCIYLGYFIGPLEPSYGYVPPRFVAYLVQTVAPPVSDFPGLNVGLVPVDAVTGAMGTRYGRAPGTILGTTCGTVP